jgi:voltage-dependent potassium channel beta subunit
MLAAPFAPGGFEQEETMEYRRLGSAGTRVSAVALGGWINFEAKLARSEARRIVGAARDQGVNFFDLADVYGQGTAERWMGDLLKPFSRHTLVIATKVFFPMSEDVNDRGLSRKHIFESIRRSLVNLGTDYVDIYFCHRPDPDTPILETARAMDDLIRQGKVLYWGTSEWEPAQIIEACDACERHGLYPPQVEQPQYSMLRRERLEQHILPVAAPRGIGLVVWSPLAMGMLTGKYDAGVPDDTRFAREPWSREAYLSDANAERVRQLKPIADDMGVTRAQLALAWCLRQPGVTSVITGATRMAQLVENVGALDVALDDAALARIDAVLGASTG